MTARDAAFEAGLSTVLTRRLLGHLRCPVLDLPDGDWACDRADVARVRAWELAHCPQWEAIVRLGITPFKLRAIELLGLLRPALPSDGRGKTFYSRAALSDLANRAARGAPAVLSVPPGSRLLLDYWRSGRTFGRLFGDLLDGRATCTGVLTGKPGLAALCVSIDRSASPAPPS